MSWWLIAPALVSIAALWVLVVALSAVARAAVELRAEVRKCKAAMVAGHELTRRAATVGAHAVSSGDAASRLAKGLPRSTRGLPTHGAPQR